MINIFGSLKFSNCQRFISRDCRTLSISTLPLKTKAAQALREELKQKLLATEAQEKLLTEERDLATSAAVGVAEIPETQVEEVPKNVEEQDVQINDSAPGLPPILPDNQMGMESFQESPAPTLSDEESQKNTDELQDTGSLGTRPISSPARAKQSVAVTSPSPPKPTESPTGMPTLVDGYHVEASPKTSSPGDSPSDSWFRNGWDHFVWIQ